MKPKEVLNWTCIEMTNMFTEYRNVLVCVYILLLWQIQTSSSPMRLHTPVSNGNWFSFHTMYYSGQYSHTQCGPTSTHGSLSLKSYVIVLYFKNATYMTKRTAQLFNQILCIWILPPQCTSYSFSNYVTVIQTAMWKQVSGCSTRPAFSYMPSLQCTVQNVQSFDPTCGKWQQFGVCNYSTCTWLTGTGLHISSFVLVLDSCAVLHEEIHISS